VSTSQFYCSSEELEVGHVVYPGRWGQTLRTYNRRFTPHWQLVRELVYEVVRLRQFSDKPSRLEALFVCSSERDLRDFQQSTGRDNELVYEVALVDPTLPNHTGDLDFVNTLEYDTVSDLEERALRYWEGQVLTKPEIATLSPAKIVRRIE